MNPSTTIGMAGGLALVLVVAVLTANDPALLWNPIGLFVVFGGTFAASLVAFPMREVFRVIRILLILMRNEKLYTEKDVEELTQVSRMALKGDIRRIERVLPVVGNPFLRTGIQLVIDGAPVDEVAHILSWRIEKLKAKEQGEANVFRAMAAFAPAFGMAGTLFGLVNMLQAMGTDAATIGLNLSVALTTTLYGILAANVIFKPIAMKIEHRTQLRVELMNTILEGVCMLAQRRAPTEIRETMKTYTAAPDDNLRNPVRPPAKNK